MSAQDWRDVPMPPGIQVRPQDARGYPITFVTFIDADGRPDFTTVDGRRIIDCVVNQVCGTCGLHLLPVGYDDQPGTIIAFIGGPGSCENGTFVDPPMHVACAEYAMQVCPHIAIPTSRYGKQDLSDGQRELYPHVSPDRPDKFGLYLVDALHVGVANHDGQPIFVAQDPEEIRWQT